MFVSEEETGHSLKRANDTMLDNLKEDGIGPENVIYVSTDKAGSSSGVMLNMLRDRANLERQGSTFLHYGEGIRIQDTTVQLAYGAIAYVDDFAGTGKQFTRSRDSVAPYIAGTFSEFLLLPCICEEAQTKIRAAGIESISEIVHERSERPFLPECNFLTQIQRERLLALSRLHWKPRTSMGFDGLATNVVFYRNAPNTTPLLFRGNLGQKPIHGIVPRYDDLPVSRLDNTT